MGFSSSAYSSSPTLSYFLEAVDGLLVLLEVEAAHAHVMPRHVVFAHVVVAVLEQFQRHRILVESHVDPRQLETHVALRVHEEHVVSYAHQIHVQVVPHRALQRVAVAEREQSLATAQQQVGVEARETQQTQHCAQRQRRLLAKPSLQHEEGLRRQTLERIPVRQSRARERRRRLAEDEQRRLRETVSPSLRGMTRARASSRRNPPPSPPARAAARS